MSKHRPPAHQAKDRGRCDVFFETPTESRRQTLYAGLILLILLIVVAVI